jgi:hypothetical protein
MLFPTPDAAADTLVSALRANDIAALQRILGPGGDEILSSGDAVADRADAERFLAYYDEEHRVRLRMSGEHILIVGDGEWPFPVPLEWTGNGYEFDTKKGRAEILNRRVGRNELAVEQVCLAIGDAQREYALLRPMGGDLPEYAQKVVSDPGKKNGLYWPTAEGEPPSPLGPLVASATAEGYRAAGSPATAGSVNASNAGSRPFHGYRFRLLTAQGPHATGGAVNYLVNGRLIGGFGVIAYPAEYGNSGVMTFITNHDGVVFERDLGPETEKKATEIHEFDPGPGWNRATPAATEEQVVGK